MAKKNKRNEGYLSIRKKLIAAVAMLLVASFMVASSSYAWFTLSTAPEVKGIQTSVGANGSLEIALYTGNQNITSNVGDSEKYDTWGNLVDLTNGSYGLDEINLYPSRLNFTSYSSTTDGTTTTVSGKINTTSPLMTPVYGADGRVESLASNTLVGYWDDSAGKFLSDKTTTGVAAIGTASGMSEQQLDWRKAMSTITASLDNVKLNAVNSLRGIGSPLANIVADYAVNKDAAKEYDVTSLGSMYDGLNAANAELKKAIVAYFTAAAAIAQQTATDTYVKVDADNISWTVSGATVTVTGPAGVTFSTLPASIEAAIMDYEKIKADVTAGQTAWNACATTGESGTVYMATWSEIDTCCQGLVDVDKITVCGKTADVLRDNMQTLVDAVLGGEGISVELPYDSGAYSDFAEYTGDYNASISIEKITYNGLTVGPVGARMKTDVEKTQSKRDMTFGITTMPSGNAASGSNLTDFYGYAIELAFRTNAKDSDLLLQTSPKDRIYSTGGNGTTQGGGSTMTFKSLTNDFTDLDVMALMGAIRIVFTAQDGTILAVAGLDTTASDAIGADGVTGQVRLYTGYEVETTVVGDTTTYGKLTTSGAFVDEANAKLMDLAANTQERLNVYVYLDGDIVTNAMVANAAQSMTGSLNLQFSSSAALTPMNYSKFMGEAAETTATTTTADTTAPSNP